MARRERDDRATTSGLADALVFLGFVLTGALYIVTAKLGGLPPAAVTMVPVSIMLVYAAAVIFIRGLRLREDQSGDNLYYMGFLFTLTSLAVSLWQFEVGGKPEDIVRNFGIAIGSTIAGIALRIFMNQMRRDPHEVERVSRLELADASRRVRRELDATVVELNQFRRTTQQIAEESWADVHARIEETATRILESVEAVTERSAVPIETASRISGEGVEAMTRTVVASLQASADALAQETAALARSAEIALAAASDRMTASLEAASARLARESQHLSGETAALSVALSGLTARVGGLSAADPAAAAQVDAALAPFIAALAAHGERIAMLTASLDAARRPGPTPAPVVEIHPPPAEEAR